jgi:hypothetical protein
LPLLRHAKATTEALLTTKAATETTLLLLPRHNMWPRHITKATLLTAKTAAEALLGWHRTCKGITKATTKAALLLLTAEAASHW